MMQFETLDFSYSACISRGFHKYVWKVCMSHYTPRRHLGERMYSSYSFSTSALDGGEWSASRLGRALAPGKGHILTSFVSLLYPKLSRPFCCYLRFSFSFVFFRAFFTASINILTWRKWISVDVRCLGVKVLSQAVEDGNIIRLLTSNGILETAYCLRRAYFLEAAVRLIHCG
jgi:hypothetical protein